MYTKNRNLMVVLLLVGFAIFLISCGQENAARGVTDTEIVIGQWGPQTGPAALWGAIARGTDCYFKMINDEGGIHGRKIRYVMRDDAYDPARTRAAVKEMVGNEGVFAFVGGAGTAPGMAVRQYLIDNEIAWISPASGSTHWAYPQSRYIFSVFPLYSDEAAVLVDYAVNQLGKEKIAMFYQNDDYGKGGLYGAEIKLENMGKALVAAVPVEITDSDVSSHALKLKESGAEVVLLYVTPKHAPMLLTEAAKIGFNPTWMSSNTLSDMPLMHKITGGKWEGVIFANFGEMPDSDSELMQKYRVAKEKYANKDERWGTFFLAGFLFAEPLVEALRRCGRDLTTDNLIEALESLKDFKGVGPKITFGPNKRQGSRAVYLARCESATGAEILTDWIEADIDIQEAIRRLVGE
jgi:ABC-type branched-subunit amino acid transport system substrate-binding protein